MHKRKASATDLLAAPAPQAGEAQMFAPTTTKEVALPFTPGQWDPILVPATCHDEQDSLSSEIITTVLRVAITTTALGISHLYNASRRIIERYTRQQYIKAELVTRPDGARKKILIDAGLKDAQSTKDNQLPQARLATPSPNPTIKEENLSLPTNINYDVSLDESDDEDYWGPENKAQRERDERMWEEAIQRCNDDPPTPSIPAREKTPEEIEMLKRMKFQRELANGRHDGIYCKRSPSSHSLIRKQDDASDTASEVGYENDLSTLPDATPTPQHKSLRIAEKARYKWLYYEDTDADDTMDCALNDIILGRFEFTEDVGPEGYYNEDELHLNDTENDVEDYTADFDFEEDVEQDVEEDVEDDIEDDIDGSGDVGQLFLCSQKGDMFYGIQKRDYKDFHERISEIAAELKVPKSIVVKFYDATKQGRVKTLEPLDDHDYNYNDPEASFQRGIYESPLVTPPTEEEREPLVDAVLRTDEGVIQLDLVEGKLSTHDFKTLLPEPFGGSKGPSGWLNDNIVNEYLSILVEAEKARLGFTHSRDGPAPPIHAFASQWYSTMKSNPKSVARWAFRKNLGNEKFLDARLILLPICDRSHWTLIAIKPQDRLVEYYDSLNGNGERYKLHVLQFLHEVLGNAYTIGQWDFRNRPSAQQKNGSDCGVFTCLNALALLRQIDVCFLKDFAEDGMEAARERMAVTLLNGKATEL